MGQQKKSILTIDAKEEGFKAFKANVKMLAYPAAALGALAGFDGGEGVVGTAASMVAGGTFGLFMGGCLGTLASGNDAEWVENEIREKQRREKMRIEEEQRMKNLMKGGFGHVR